MKSAQKSAAKSTLPEHRVYKPSASPEKKQHSMGPHKHHMDHSIHNIMRRTSLRAKHDDFLERDVHAHKNLQKEKNQKHIMEETNRMSFGPVAASKPTKLSEFIDNRVSEQVDSQIQQYKDEIWRSLAEQRNDSFMQIEHHIRTSAAHSYYQRVNPYTPYVPGSYYGKYYKYSAYNPAFSYAPPPYADPGYPYGAPYGGPYGAYPYPPPPEGYLEDQPEDEEAEAEAPVIVNYEVTSKGFKTHKSTREYPHSQFNPYSRPESSDHDEGDTYDGQASQKPSALNKLIASQPTNLVKSPTREQQQAIRYGSMGKSQEIGRLTMK